MGRFQAADRGTLFLDEIGDLPLELQPKLLRALQEKEFERLGGGRPIQVDVRVIAATNQDLWQMVQEKKFRADLYYRLNVFPMMLPPLRERRDDIPLLVQYFVEKFASQQGKAIDTIPDDVMAALEQHDWEGNIRELQNVIERGVIMTTGPVLSELTTGHLARSQSAYITKPASTDLASTQTLAQRRTCAYHRDTSGKELGNRGSARSGSTTWTAEDNLIGQNATARNFQRRVAKPLEAVGAATRTSDWGLVLALDGRFGGRRFTGSGSCRRLIPHSRENLVRSQQAAAAQAILVRPSTRAACA